MENVISSLVLKMKNIILSDLKIQPTKENGTLSMIINAYNRYMEDERDGVGYLFDINNQEHLKHLVNKCEITAEKIAQLYNRYYKYKSTPMSPLFFCDSFHEEPKLVGTWEKVIRIVEDWLDGILFCVIAYPDIKEYNAIYTKYVTDYMIVNRLVP